MMVLVCSLRHWEVEAEGLRVQDQPLLHSKFKASQGFTRPCLQQQQNIFPFLGQSQFSTSAELADGGETRMS